MRQPRSTSAAEASRVQPSSHTTMAFASQQPRRRLDAVLAGALVVLVLVYSSVAFVLFYSITHLRRPPSYATTETFLNSNNDASSPDVQYSLIHKFQRQSFPLHVGNDTERIAHPGLALVKDSRISSSSSSSLVEATTTTKANQNRRKSLSLASLPTTLVVPKFFEDSHGYLYGGSIREYLGGGKQLPTPEQALSVGSFALKMDKTKTPTQQTHHPSPTRLETIYVSVASYRDYECRLTVDDLFARAQFPERIRVAIIDQIMMNDGGVGEEDGGGGGIVVDDPCNVPVEPCEDNPHQSLCTYAHLIDYYSLNAKLAVGPVFARHLAHRFYRGEYFAMQVDSHVRFVQHWDTDIIAQWESAENEMAVLTTYLSDITGSIDPITHTSTHLTRPIMCASNYEDQGSYRHLRHGQQPEGVPQIHGQPTLQPFWAAGFSFARGHFVLQVPYDQYLPMVFQGEEISMGLRGFTYGYDYYAPERGICFHMYASKDASHKRKKVPHFWENQNFYLGVGVASMKRLNMIIQMGHHPDHEWQHQDQGKYGLGTIRNTTQFFSVFGIHTDSQTVEQHLCSFVGQPMMKVFRPALRPNRMGLDYDKIHYAFKDPTPNQK